MSRAEKGMRIGVFGGTFNPLHVGHLNALTTVKQRLNFDLIKVVPAARNPQKAPVEGPSDDQRVEMVRRGLAEFSEYIEVDDIEVRRGGMSYTVDTLTAYAKEIPPEDLYLIIGLDQFEEFDKWKDFEKILDLANLVVVTRPRHSIPISEDDVAPGLQKLIAAFDRQFIQLTTGRSVEFVRLQDVDVSASEVRKRIRTGRNVDAQISIAVEDYVKENQLYAPIGPKIGNYEAFTKFCAQALFDKKAINVRGFDLTGIESATEYSLIASGTSTRHASALAEAVQRAVKDEFNVFPMSVEGNSEGRWVLLRLFEELHQLLRSPPCTATSCPSGRWREGSRPVGRIASTAVRLPAGRRRRRAART
ncbi:MAG: nicotinate (nicotinamide) nucleotide adenylyltransferase, partial [Bdellovibrionota bacterium]